MRALIVAVAALAGCGGDDCVEVSTSCTPQYEPTFDQVYANTLSPSCAIAGCHGGDVGQGGLAMGADPDAAYRALLGYVTPGDPGCSVVVEHLEPEGFGDMPPGITLSEEERCSIRQWIANGADR